ncbi:dihydrofolate reductase family protein [Nigerium massiliense]|uniref:dihydrofolate reductase family protein n=1 Tax=Nigerium massiliense TaxID=1522317 RepID=UPI000694B7CF|nr:dihydrofolate reductase family protein [Nigerium massiliense]
MTNDRRADVIWHTTMSLDGFVADSDETMKWVFDLDTGGGATAKSLVPRLGALVVGRRTMAVEDEQQPGFYGGAYSGPFFVLTSNPGRKHRWSKGCRAYTCWAGYVRPSTLP